MSFTQPNMFSSFVEQVKTFANFVTHVTEEEAQENSKIKALFEEEMHEEEKPKEHTYPCWEDPLYLARIDMWLSAPTKSAAKVICAAMKGRQIRREFAIHEARVKHEKELLEQIDHLEAIHKVDAIVIRNLYGKNIELTKTLKAQQESCAMLKKQIAIFKKHKRGDRNRELLGWPRRSR